MGPSVNQPSTEKKLIDAIQANDAVQVSSLLDAGANPDTPYLGRFPEIKVPDSCNDVSLPLLFRYCCAKGD